MTAVMNREYSPRPRRRWGRTLAVIATMIGLTLGSASTATGQTDDGSMTEVQAEEAELQASVVAAEDRRLTEVRTITSLARWQGKNWKTPYRISNSSGYTLVLTPRSSPYTIDDLLELAPQTFLKMTDGSYLLAEHLVVLPRAELTLSAPGGLVLRLASGPDGFATIVSLGGELKILGEEGSATHVTSWDAGVGFPDETLLDGRAYIRAIGGGFEANHLIADHLGFWSGRTGGIALTGTDRPNTGAIESVDPADDGDGRSVGVLDGVTLQPAGQLDEDDPTPAVGFDVPALSFVSSRIADVTVENSAYGLFVSGANGVEISDSVFSKNLFDGVLLHRYVTNALITGTTASDNAGDGFALDRATSGVTINRSVATGNTGSGFVLIGRSLADGPSAVGTSTRSYGNSSVSNSTATMNGDYGIEVLGGLNISLNNNEISGHETGIRVADEADHISITGNQVRDSERHGIALVDGVTASSVTGNVVAEASTGVYVRDSTVAVKGNTVERADGHGVSLVGRVDGSEVSYNALAGRGGSALDTRRSNGQFTGGTNNFDGWKDTTPWWRQLRKLLQPMTALWTILLALVGTSAIRARKAPTTVGHPYAHQMAHRGAVPVPQPR